MKRARGSTELAEVLEIGVANRATSENLSGGGRAIRAPRRAKVERALREAALVWKGKRAGARENLGAEVVWVADREMRALEKRFVKHFTRRLAPRGGATDVLAFEDARTDPETGRRMLGEIVCNLELARREAERHGHTREAEAVLYATHGLVHLLGGRDETPQERRKMRLVELRALRAAGLSVRGGEWD